MNVCFLQGKIISQVKFDFFYNSKKYISVAKFDILLNQNMNIYDDSTVISVKGYDNQADEIYRNFQEGDYIGLIGYLQEDMVVITDIES